MMNKPKWMMRKMWMVSLAMTGEDFAIYTKINATILANQKDRPY